MVSLREIVLQHVMRCCCEKSLQESLLFVTRDCTASLQGWCCMKLNGVNAKYCTMSLQEVVLCPCMRLYDATVVAAIPCWLACCCNL